jgi:hypothetical protein
LSIRAPIDPEAFDTYLGIKKEIARKRSAVEQIKTSIACTGEGPAISRVSASELRLRGGCCQHPIL